MKQLEQGFRKSLESTLDIIGDLIPASIGLRSPTVALEKAEQFLHRKSRQLEAFIEKKLHGQHQKETIRQEIEELPELPLHNFQTHKSFDKGLSREDILKRLTEIDRMILTRELQQNIEHKRYQYFL